MYMNRKGIVFSYRDTFSLDSTLTPIILAALLKFKQVINEPENSAFKGVPGAILTDMYGKSNVGDYTEEQLEAASAWWMEILDHMIYAFDKKSEPDISKYDFKFIHPIGNGTTNPEEYDRYCKDSEVYEQKAQEGRELFGKYLNTLWW